MNRTAFIMKNFLVLVIFLVILSVSGSANVIKVCPIGCEYSSIQEAVNAANSGDTLEIKPWEYREKVQINKDLTLKSTTKEDFTLGGRQKEGTVLVAGPGSINVKLLNLKIARAKGGIKIKGKSKVEILNSVITESNSEASALVSLHDSSGLTMENSKITNNKRHAIKLHGSNKVDLNNVKIKHNGHYYGRGIICSRFSKVTIRNSEIKENVDMGIDAGGTLIVENSVISGNNGSGIWAGGNITWAGGKIVIRNSEIKNNKGTGLWAGGKKTELKLSNTNISNNSSGGLTLSKIINGEVDNCVITDNSGEDGSESGIYLSQSKVSILNSLIKGNNSGVSVDVFSYASLFDSKIFNNTQHGVLLKGQSRVKILSSTISQNKTGLYIQRTSRRALTESPSTANVRDSTFQKNSLGIYLKADSKLALTQCSFLENEDSGISTSDSSRLKASHSNISGGKYGISHLNSSGSKLENIKLTENDKGVIAKDSSNFELKNSSVINNKSKGVIIKDNAQATIENSRVSDNEADGVNIKDSAKVAIANSDVSKNSNGVVFQGSSRGDVSNNDITSNQTIGIFSNSERKIYGSGNIMKHNGTDLVGLLPGSLRLPLVKQTKEKILYPNEHNPTLQHAVDALVPGGELVIKRGEYETGLTISKPVVLKSKTSAGVTLTKKNDGIVFSILKGGSIKLEGAFTIDSPEAGQEILKKGGLWD